MEDLALGRIAVLVPEFAVKDLPLGRTLMMVIIEDGTDQEETLSIVSVNFYKIRCNDQVDLFMQW